MGDPPQEEQGLYSVFDSDASTLDLIGEHARRLHALGKTRPWLRPVASAPAP